MMSMTFIKIIANAPQNCRYADGYVNICINIIEKFNALAPYEKYSGGNELEWKMMLDELRHDSNS